ncbi:MAG: ATP-binding protein [Thermotoga sp.]|nr:MAG: ATP-binding protein [Thermotoga sp.]
MAINTNIDQDKIKIDEKMKKIGHKFLVMSGKGGVGKTTVAVNLSISLIEKGYKVGILDVDIHGPNVPKMLGIEEMQLAGEGNVIEPVIVKSGLKVVSMAFLLRKEQPVIWRGPLKMKAIKQFLGDVNWGTLDYLIIDSPPGTGDEPLSVMQLIPESDGAIIVTTPQDVALLDASRSVNFARALKIPIIGIIENMSGLICPYCGNIINLFKSGGGEKLAKEMDVPFIGKIPMEVSVVEDGDNGKPVLVEHPESQVAKAFQEIAKRISNYSG